MRAEPSPTDVVQNDRSVRSTSVDNVSQCNAQPGQRQRARDSSTRRVMTPGPSSSDVVMCRLRSAVEVAGAVACAPPNVDGVHGVMADAPLTGYSLACHRWRLASEHTWRSRCSGGRASCAQQPAAWVSSRRAPQQPGLTHNWWWPRCWRILRAKGAPLLKIARGHGLSEKEDPYTIHRWKALTQAHITACMPERYHSHSAFPKVEMKKSLSQTPLQPTRHNLAGGRFWPFHRVDVA
jgi:hypothetical protein